MTGFWVGRVRFAAVASAQDKVLCAACQKRVLRTKAASHARQRHRSLSEGVLAGQLGLPETGVPDVPS